MVTKHIALKHSPLKLVHTDLILLKDIHQNYLVQAQG